MLMSGADHWRTWGFPRPGTKSVLAPPTQPGYKAA